MKGNLGLLTAMLLLSGGGVGVGTSYNERELNNPSNYKGKGFSGGEAPMREFIINGEKIKATNLAMAKKKYANLKKKK